MNLHLRNRFAAFLSVAAVLTFAVPQGARAESVLLGVGDSFAFGYTTQINPLASNGDQGYIAPFADSLTALNGGVRPTVQNFAIPGETSNSFYSGVTADPYLAVYPYPAGLVDAPLRDALLNTNYSDSAAKQRDATLATIAADHALGKTVDNIVVQIGGNDLLELLLQDSFLNLAFSPNPADQLQASLIVNAQFTKLQTNYGTLLGTLRVAAPEAHIFTIGYENSFRGLPGGDFTDQLTLNANTLIQGVSAAFGARYVDIYTPFFGREDILTYSHIEQNNPHPTAAGYAVIATTLQAAAAPEPATLALFALALPVAIIARRRRA